jgi:hypothetical protein
MAAGSRRDHAGGRRMIFGAPFILLAPSAAAFAGPTDADAIAYISAVETADGAALEIKIPRASKLIQYHENGELPAEYRAQVLPWQSWNAG